MKRILIAGAGSYLGEHIAAWLDRAPDSFQTHTLDLRGGDWKRFDFSGYHAVVLVAGIAHQRETPDNAALYETVNHLLAVDVARAAKAAGVEQFVFFSSMSVYGLTVGRIKADTPACPDTYYGKSKLAAEVELTALACDSFRVAVLRPPMIYGRGCKGNYPRLSALVRKLPVFPRVNNARSMLYIDNLCAFMQALLISGQGGVFFPQNSEYVSTNALAVAIAAAHGKRLWQPRGMGWLITRLAARGGSIGKVFGTLTYEQAMSDAFRQTPQPSLEETILATEADA